MGLQLFKCRFLGFFFILFYFYYDIYAFVSTISPAKESYKFLTKYLATFSSEDAYTLSEAKEEAVNTIIDFVKAPDLFQVLCFQRIYKTNGVPLCFILCWHFVYS